MLLVFGCGVAALALAYVFRDRLLEIDLRGMVARLAEIGPWPFFLAMAILPAMWVPVSPFLVLAGAMFDLPLALVGTALALTANMAGSWLVAGKLLRPPLERLVHRFGYSVPELGQSNMMQVAFLLRITPGVPFALQNYLLGLARMPFGRYLLVSMPVSLSVACAIVYFGDALLRGELGVAMIAVAAIVLMGIGVRWMRARMKARLAE